LDRGGRRPHGSGRTGDQSAPTGNGGGRPYVLGGAMGRARRRVFRIRRCSRYREGKEGKGRDGGQHRCWITWRAERTRPCRGRRKELDGRADRMATQVSTQVAPRETRGRAARRFTVASRGGTRRSFLANSREPCSWPAPPAVHSSHQGARKGPEVRAGATPPAPSRMEAATLQGDRRRPGTR